MNFQDVIYETVKIIFDMSNSDKKLLNLIQCGVNERDNSLNLIVDKLYKDVKIFGGLKLSEWNDIIEIIHNDNIIIPFRDYILSIFNLINYINNISNETNDDNIIVTQIYFLYNIFKKSIDNLYVFFEINNEEYLINYIYIISHKYINNDILQLCVICKTIHYRIIKGEQYNCKNIIDIFRRNTN